MYNINKSHNIMCALLMIQSRDIQNFSIPAELLWAFTNIWTAPKLL